MNASFELDGYSKNGGGVQRSRSAGCGGSAHASPAVTRAQSSGSGEIEPGKIVVKRIPLGCTQAMLRESFGRSVLDQTVFLCVFCGDAPSVVWHWLLSRLCALRHACRFGRIKSAYVPVCKDSRPPIGFIQFDDAASAKAAAESSVLVGEAMVTAYLSYKKEGDTVVACAV